MKIVKAFVAGAVIALVLPCALAQADSMTQQALDEIALKSERITSYTADIRIESSVMGRSRIAKGTVAFKVPDSIQAKSGSNL